MKTSITCLLIYVKFPFFFPLTYNFLCLQGPISYSRIVFWTPKSDIRQNKEWKFDVVDEGARRSEKELDQWQDF